MGAQSTFRTEGPSSDRSLAVQSLAQLLAASLTALAAAGEVEAACRLAGKACVDLRQSDPVIARRFDVLLHRLTPKLTW